MSRPEPIRVLHLVAGGGRRGAEIFASDLVRALARHEVAQEVAVVTSPVPLAVEYDSPVRVMGTGRWRVPALGVDVRALSAVRALVRSFRPHVIQSHGGEPLKYLALVGGRPPIVHRRIGLVQHRVGRVRVAAHGWLMRMASMTVAVAEAVREETIARFGVDPERIVTIRNAVDRERLRPVRGRQATRQALGIASSDTVLLSVGALRAEKDPLAYVELFASVSNEHPEALLMFVGDGPLDAHVRYELRRRGLDGRSRLLGDRDDMGDVMAAADIAILASPTEGMEGMPASVIEAGMAGIPTASYGVGGVPEVVQNGATGLLAAPGEIGELTRCVLTLLENDSMRRAMGAEARRRYTARFDIGAIANDYLEVYQTAATSPLAA